MYDTNDLNVQFELLKKCAYHMLQPIGGSWKNDEVLFHIIPEGKIVDEEQKAIIRLLFD